MWRMLAQLMHRIPDVGGPYNPPLTGQVDRFDIFPADLDSATCTYPDGSVRDGWGDIGAIGS